MNERMFSILIVDDEPDYRETLSLLFETLGYRTAQAGSAEEALTLLEQRFFPLVVTDMMMEGMSGIDLLKIVKANYSDEIEVIMVTGYGSIETAVETMKIGAFGYFIKSHDPAELRQEIEKAVECLEARKRKLIDSSQDSFVIGSRNPQMARIWALVNKVADSNANVLITGESGTGKEIVAKRLHDLSSRRDRPFVPINCQSMPPGLIESELFGYEKGAFTGAGNRHIGKLEQGSGGTVFLDEIGDMSMDIQVKLLRTLENHQIERIGSTQSVDVNFRVVSATNKDIRKAVDEGNFREDLMYRINTFEIHVPPLRDRREDIPDLVECFIRKYAAETGKYISGMSDDTKNYLMNYSYPGNIRELKNIVERLVILAPKDGILSLEGNRPESGAECPEVGRVGYIESYKDAKRDFEIRYIRDVLKREGGNITWAAEAMGLSRRQLFNKIKELNIRVD
ncbi:sigma-54 dependent transcriptional regulator [Hornefia butyriciproducens]|uniref:sigma-54-dependent transcriptional regulator n=1 Tax=Hornefia butyriciproducens TaxID=2652293 RepID=UPI002A91C6FB|nr:sigma-54 dependent transcriptional regulator [Hornefia butyriciproducens]MDY6211415.1 sigma-54 dependent transcriptional regulator [Hornefia butyriciproducens]